MKVGLIGFGYWGPNLARNFYNHGQTSLVRIAEIDPQRCAAARELYPGVDIVDDAALVTGATDLDAVAIATPVRFHFELALAALQSGKHVWVEKPMTSNSDQARQLLDTAGAKRLTIVVGHTFLFHGAVQEIKRAVQAGELGELFYYDSVRVNLGLFQHDVNVIWDLAPHDLSIMDYILGPDVQAIAATGSAHFGEFEDVGYLTVTYPNNLLAHIHVNWLSPVKVRKTLLGGSKSMVVWDDLSADEKIKVYDRGVDIVNPEGRYQLLASYRMGPMYSPTHKRHEPLQAEVTHFVECVNSGQTPINSGESGLRIVRMLEASDKSLRGGGALVPLEI